MKNISEIPVTCPQCGHEHDADMDACPNCGTMRNSGVTDVVAWSTWARARDSLKTRWVASVMAFWVSAAVLGIVLFLQGKLNLILVSIALGMLLIGVWMKARYQLHLRNEPDRPAPDDQPN